MTKEYHVYTNKLWNKQMVAYRASKVEEAIFQEADLVCHTEDRPGDTMTIPNFLIKRLMLSKTGRMVKDRTGAKVKLYDYWWKSDREKLVEYNEAKVEDKKQLKLI